MARRSTRRSASGNDVYMGLVAHMEMRSIDSNFRDTNNKCQCTNQQITELRHLLNLENILITVPQAAFFLQRSWNDVAKALENMKYRKLINNETLNNIISNREGRREMDVEDGNDGGNNISSGNNNNNNVVDIVGRGGETNMVLDGEENNDNNDNVLDIGDGGNKGKVKFGRTPPSVNLKDDDEDLGGISIVGGSTSHRMTTRRKSSKGEETVRIMFTGIICTPEYRKMIKALGAEYVENVEDAHTATHVIASDGISRMRRTPKLMIGLSCTSNIVYSNYLDQSYKHQMLLDTDDFLIVGDSEAEIHYGFKMVDTLRNGISARAHGGVLGGLYVYICLNVGGNKAPDTKELCLIIEGAGGTVLQSLLPGSSTFDPSKTVILTSEPSTKAQLREQGVSEVEREGAKILSTLWLHQVMITQSLGSTFEVSDSDEEEDNSGFLHYNDYVTDECWGDSMRTRDALELAAESSSVAAESSSEAATSSSEAAESSSEAAESSSEAAESSSVADARVAACRREESIIDDIIMEDPDEDEDIVLLKVMTVDTDLSKSECDSLIYDYFSVNRVVTVGEEYTAKEKTMFVNFRVISSNTTRKNDIYFDAMTGDIEIVIIEDNEDNEVDNPTRIIAPLTLLPRRQVDYSNHFDAVIKSIRDRDREVDVDDLVPGHFKDQSRIGNTYVMNDTEDEFLVIGKTNVDFIMQSLQNIDSEVVAGQIVFLRWDSFMDSFNAGPKNHDDEPETPVHDGSSSDDESSNGDDMLPCDARRTSARVQGLSPQLLSDQIIEQDSQREWHSDSESADSESESSSPSPQKSPPVKRKKINNDNNLTKAFSGLSASGGSTSTKTTPMTSVPTAKNTGTPTSTTSSKYTASLQKAIAQNMDKPGEDIILENEDDLNQLMTGSAIPKQLEHIREDEEALSDKGDSDNENLSTVVIQQGHNQSSNSPESTSSVWPNDTSLRDPLRDPPSRMAWLVNNLPTHKPTEHQPAMKYTGSPQLVPKEILDKLNNRKKGKHHLAQPLLTIYNAESIEDIDQEFWKQTVIANVTTVRKDKRNSGVLLCAALTCIKMVHHPVRFCHECKYKTFSEEELKPQEMRKWSKVDQCHVLTTFDVSGHIFVKTTRFRWNNRSPWIYGSLDIYNVDGKSKTRLICNHGGIRCLKDESKTHCPKRICNACTHGRTDCAECNPQLYCSNGCGGRRARYTNLKTKSRIKEMEKVLERHNSDMSIEEASSKCTNCIYIEVYGGGKSGFVSAETACKEGIKHCLDQDEVIYQAEPTMVMTASGRFYYPDQFLIGKFCHVLVEWDEDYHSSYFKEATLIREKDIVRNVEPKKPTLILRVNTGIERFGPRDHWAHIVKAVYPIIKSWLQSSGQEDLPIDWVGKLFCYYPKPADGSQNYERGSGHVLGSKYDTKTSDDKSKFFYWHGVFAEGGRTEDQRDTLKEAMEYYNHLTK